MYGYGLMIQYYLWDESTLDLTSSVTLWTYEEGLVMCHLPLHQRWNTGGWAGRSLSVQRLIPPNYYLFSLQVWRSTTNHRSPFCFVLRPVGGPGLPYFQSIYPPHTSNSSCTLSLLNYPFVHLLTLCYPCSRTQTLQYKKLVRIQQKLQRRP